MKNVYKLLISLLLLSPLYARQSLGGDSDTLEFICGELLCKPTSNSITINACTNFPADVYIEFGQDSVVFSSQTTVQRSNDSIPFNFLLENLMPNAQYFYRMKYKATGQTTYSSRNIHSFHTKRSTTGTFSFAIEADPHLDTNSNPAVYTLTLQNMLLKKPDFLIDLGDTFMSEKLPVINQLEITKRHLLFRNYFDKACHSLPLFLVIGNHEGELGWRLDGTATSLPVMAANTRKLYYPNPLPNSFYTGNTKSEQFVGLRENYYAWEWGNVLFIVLDPYWYTTTKPGWGWTLGIEQYNWFKNTITTSQAKFKYIFAHQLIGGNGNDGRGGVEYAHLWENGGRNADSTWGYEINRPNWGKTIHQLMVENNATIFFHGHDHFYGKQDKDGVVYQEVPQPSLKSYTTNSAANYGYVNGVILPNRGYLLVTVTDSTSKVEYIRTYLPNEENAQRHNLDVSHSYTITKSGQISNITEYIPVVKSFALEQNYPNPFNPGTTIQFAVPNESRVNLVVYNVLGEVIKELINEIKAAGTHTIRFNGSDLPSGVYFYKIEVYSTDGVNNFRDIKKLIKVN